MMQVKPVASASPNGDFRVARHLRWITKSKLEEIEAAEQAHRDRIAAEALIIKRDVHPVAFSNFENSHQAVIAEFGDFSSLCRGICHVRRVNRSRAHELHKSKLRLMRRSGR